jgi:hypothetical protein
MLICHSSSNRLRHYYILPGGAKAGVGLGELNVVNTVHWFTQSAFSRKSAKETPHSHILSSQNAGMGALFHQLDASQHKEMDVSDRRQGPRSSGEHCGQSTVLVVSP